MSSFEKQRKKWKPENCSCRLCKTDIQQAGFINETWTLVLNFSLSGSSKIFRAFSFRF